MFRISAVLALIASAASAVNFTPTGDIVASSDLGSRLLSAATVVKEPRSLEQNNQDITFIATYSLKYLGCSSLVQVRQNGQNGGNNNNNNKNGNVGMLMEQHLVKFALCPDGCSSCANGGEYIVNMETFVDLYTEYKLKDMEWTCEMIRENCYCDNADDGEVCLDACYTTAGMTDCINYEGEQDEFKVQEYLQCAALGKQGGNNNNNNNNNGNNAYGYYDANGNWGQYYMGPYCNAKDGKSIHIGVFMDGGCTSLTDDEVYTSKNYGVPLPFSASTGKSLVVSNDCVACTEQQRENNNNNNNNNNNQNNNVKVNELCENSYKWAAKCETNLGEIYGYYKDSSACEYIQNILPRMDYASRNSNISKSGNAKGAKAFATIFAFTTALFAGYAYFLYRKIKRGSVNLSMQE